MTGGNIDLIKLGRRMLFAIHVAFCVFLVLAAVLSGRYLTTGANLQFDEPWDSIFVYGFLTCWVAVLLCWGVFCLVFARFLRRRGQATNSLTQLVAVFRVVIPMRGGRYYDRTMRKERPQLNSSTAPNNSG